MAHLTALTQYLDPIVFALYCLLFMITVLTFKQGSMLVVGLKRLTVSAFVSAAAITHLSLLLLLLHVTGCSIILSSVITLIVVIGLIRFQLSQLMWTVATVVMVVLQTKFLAECALNGLFWFFFPMAAVVMNDVSAYFCGISLGRRIFSTPFLALSPNKTWEGFIGGAVLTVIFSFFFPALLAKYPWFTCPAEQLTFVPPAIESVTCTVNEIFLPKAYNLPTSMAGLVGVDEGGCCLRPDLCPRSLLTISWTLQ